MGTSKPLKNTLRSVRSPMSRPPGPKGSVGILAPSAPGRPGCRGAAEAVLKKLRYHDRLGAQGIKLRERAGDVDRLPPLPTSTCRQNSDGTVCQLPPGRLGASRTVCPRYV